MFGTDDQPERRIVLLASALRFFGQLVLCYPAALVAGAPITFLLSKFGLSGAHPQSDVYFAGYEALICLFIGPFVGWCAGRAMPLLVVTGRWIWVAPAILLLSELTLQVRIRAASLPEFLFATSANEGLGVFLVTLPVGSVAGYSIGMALVGMRRLRAVLVRRHAVALALASTAVFSLCVGLLGNYEREKLEWWSRLRTVVDPLGVVFSPEAKSLCANPQNAPVSIRLTRGTRVERLENRFCKDGRLSDTDAGRDGFMVDKVRVLTGPSTGMQGWVGAYGLNPM